MLWRSALTYESPHFAGFFGNTEDIRTRLEFSFFVRGP